MEQTNLPDDIKRFILISIESVPHLEAIVLFHREPEIEWDPKMIAQSLFINEKKAAEILVDLYNSGFTVKQKDIPLYQYLPNTPELGTMVGRLAEVYNNNLIEVTLLIHSKINKQAQIFGDSFKWQTGKDG
jgi:hypothetical protein